MANKESLLKYIDLTDWKRPENQTYYVSLGIISFMAKCPDGIDNDFQAYSTSVILDKEKKNNDFKKLSEIKHNNAIISLQEYIWDTLKDNCLIHPKLYPYFDEYEKDWFITKKQANKHNKYWAKLAKEILPNGDFVVPVTEIRALNPKNGEFEEFV